MSSNQALIKRSDVNGNGLATTVPPKQPAQVQPLTEELVDQLLAGRGLRGWWRAARVARVLGLFSLYLFLDTYDVRADFNRRVVTKLRDLARERGRRAQFNAWVKAHVKSERGASLVEYALLVALIAVVCIAAVTTLGKAASSKFSTVGASISA